MEFDTETGCRGATSRPHTAGESGQRVRKSDEHALAKNQPSFLRARADEILAGNEIDLRNAREKGMCAVDD